MVLRILKGKWKDRLVFYRGFSAEEADETHPPLSTGFVCVYDASTNEYLGWCGSVWINENSVSVSDADNTEYMPIARKLAEAEK